MRSKPFTNVLKPHADALCHPAPDPYTIMVTPLLSLMNGGILMKSTTINRRLIAAFVVSLAYLLPAAGQDRSVPPPADRIHTVFAEHGMVVAQEKIAAQIGGDILRQGGNAIDAAVATGFAMAVTYPRAGNIGGGGFMLIHRSTGEDVAIDYREMAPGAMTRDSFLGPDGKPDDAKSRDSALGIGVPGTVAGLALALDKYGSG